MKKKLLLKSLFIILSLSIYNLAIHNYSFASNGMAFSVGSNYGWFQINTTNDAKTAATQYRLAGYSSFYSVEPTYDILRGNFNNGTQRLSSDILFVAGHSNRSAMYFNYNNKGGSYKTGISYMYDTNDDGYELAGLLDHCNRQSVILATFAGCNTASTTDSQYNLCHVITKTLWAQAAVGWHSEVDDSANRTFCAAYNKALANGYGLLDSIYYGLAADTFDPATNISNITLYADNPDLVIKKSSRSLLTSDNSKLSSLNFVDINLMTNRIFDQNNMNNIYDFITEINPDFNASDYDIKISNICGNNYVVTLTLKIGNYITNSVYNIFIKDNTISSVVDNTKKVDSSAKQSLKNSTVNYSLSGQYKQSVKNAILAEQGGTITDQKITYYYDIDTNTKKCIVYNTHVLGKTSDAMSVLSKEIKLN